MVGIPVKRQNDIVLIVGSPKSEAFAGIVNQFKPGCPNSPRRRSDRVTDR
jgi:hypothetical protein